MKKIILILIILTACQPKYKKEDNPDPIPPKTLKNIAIVDNIIISNGSLKTISGHELIDVTHDSDESFIVAEISVSSVYLETSEAQYLALNGTASSIPKPIKSSRISNSKHIIKADKYYYINSDNELMSFDESGDQQKIKDGVIQFAVDQSGDTIYQDNVMMYYRKINGFSAPLVTTLPGDIKDWEFYPLTKQFFFAKDAGFILLQDSNDGDFFSIYNRDNQIRTRYQQANAYDPSNDYGQLITSKQPEDCKTHSLVGSYLLDCGDELYQFYDSTKDAILVDLSFADVYGETEIVTVGNSILVFYGDESTGYRLTRITGDQCKHLFSSDYVSNCGGMQNLSTWIVYDITKLISYGDKAAFCGTRLYDNAEMVVLIENLESNPVFTEVSQAHCD